MSWLARFRRRRAGDGLVCYLRENGPIGYAADLFGRAPRARVDAMLETGLAWYWKAHRAIAPRDWTELTRWSLGAMLDDLADAATTRVVVLGLDEPERSDAVTDAQVGAWIHGFNTDAAGPMHVVITRPAGGGDLLFVAQQPPESVRGLLQAWHIARDRAHRVAYARLPQNSRIL